MIRLASVGDAGELERLNAEFNGKGKTTEESIRARFLQTGARLSSLRTATEDGSPASSAFS
ncbi:MAG: hypothetical protein UF217_03825 [Acutalibacteraceae bacterium]|nr:hypothetical protein [Acutalibacteraceae bacterium]